MRLLFMTLLGLLVATPALAIDIDGKWGIGAGFGNSSTEVSVIKGGAGGALVFDFQFSGFIEDLEEEDPSTAPQDIKSEIEQYSINVGPRMRRFMRPTAKLSPYWDVFLHGVVQSSSQTLTDQTSGTSVTGMVRRIGGEGGLGLGLEFESAWGFNFALDTSVLTVQMLTSRTHQNNGVTATDLRGTRLTTFGGFAPRVLVRGYW